MAKRIYLDFNATHPLRREIVGKWKSYWEVFGNPSSAHAEGRRARTALDEARERIAACLGAPRRGVIFVGSGTEANNQVIASVSPGSHVVTSTIEHACVRQAVRRHLDDGGSVTELAVDRAGRVNRADLAAAVRPNTALVSVMIANNETGVIQPIPELAAIARSHRIIVHTDATQAVGKIPVSMAALGVDVMTISAHKLGGPKGIAALIISDDDWVKPFILGGPQERGLRAGTEAVPLALAFADAVELAVAEMATVTQRQHELTAYIRQRVAYIPDLEFNSGDDGLPNTINLSIPGLRGEHVVRNLDLAGISVSTGSACSTGAVDPSHVIRALGKPEWVIRSAFRVSMGATTQLADVAKFCDELDRLVREHSPTGVTPC
ncbi:cysteine desulfurase [bacterium]|nr:cysteine desulfurase [bacterium]